MIVSAENVAATLSLVVPGFVALSVFYWFGLKVKRADWRWAIWSVLASVPIVWLAGLIAERIGATHEDLTEAFADCGVEAAGTAQSIPDFEEALRGCATAAVAGHNPELRLAIGVGVAVVLAAGAVAVWHRLARTWPWLNSRAQPMAWGVALRPLRWLEVKTSDGDLYSGYNREVADPVESDKLDLYLGKPMLIRDGKAEALEGVEGILIRHEDILSIRVMAPLTSDDAGGA